MNDPRSALVRGAIVRGAIGGAFAMAGVCILVLWRLATASPAAGAMVDGQFKPYQNDPVWSMIAGGGLVLLAGGLGSLAWEWRKPRY